MKKPILSYSEMKKSELEKASRADQGKTLAQKKSRREENSPFKDGAYSDMKGVNLGTSSEGAKHEGEEKGPKAEKTKLGQSQKGLNQGKNMDVQRSIHDNVMKEMKAIDPKIPGPHPPKPLTSKQAPKNSLLQSELAIGKSYKDTKREDLEKGVATKVALLASLAGGIAHTKGTLFNGPDNGRPHQEVNRSIANEPAHEMDDQDAGKHVTVDDKSGATFTHSYRTPKEPIIRHVVSDKASTVKQKLASIRDQIKGME